MMDALAVGVAAHLVICKTCGAEVNHLSLDEEGRSECVPCRHPADLLLIPNPNLNQEEET